MLDGEMNPGCRPPVGRAWHRGQVGSSSIAPCEAVGYTGPVTDPYPLRPDAEDEFEAWARMVTDTRPLLAVA